MKTLSPYNLQSGQYNLGFLFFELFTFEFPYICTKRTPAILSTLRFSDKTCQSYFNQIMRFYYYYAMRMSFTFF